MNSNPLQRVLVKIFQMKGANAMNTKPNTHILAQELRLLFAAALVAGLTLSAQPAYRMRAEPITDYEGLSKTCFSQIPFEVIPVVPTRYESPHTPPFWEAYAVSGGDTTDCANWKYVEIADPLQQDLVIRPATTFVPQANELGGAGYCAHSHLNYSVFGQRRNQSNWEYIGGGGMVGKWTGSSCTGPTVHPGDENGNTESFHRAVGLLWGTDQVGLQDNPYQRIIVALQAPSHGVGSVAGCPTSGCFHQVKLNALVSLLDDFSSVTHPGGRLGPNWGGMKRLGNYIVQNDQLNVTGGGPLYWTGDIFGADQQAYITLAKVDPGGEHQSLLLKVQGIWSRGTIAVFYNATTNQIGIETYDPIRGWRTLKTVNVVLVDGDQLGARALASGTVEAYFNGIKVASADAGPFFDNENGRVGLWFINASNAVLDDFMGSTITH